MISQEASTSRVDQLKESIDFGAFFTLVI